MRSKKTSILLVVIMVSTVFGVAIPGSVSAQVYPSGIVAAWKFDENSGLTASDSSGNGNYGSLIGDPEWTSGKINSAIKLDGQDDIIEVSDSSTLRSPTTAITMAAWIYLDEIDKNHWICEKFYGAQRIWGSYSMGVWNDNKIIFSICNGELSEGGGNSYVYWHSDATLEANTWYFIACTWKYNGEHIPKIYLNEQSVGVSVDFSHGELSSIQHGIGGELEIGRCANSYQPRYYFDGILDELEIYNRALTGDEIYQRYMRTVSLWKFEENFQDSIDGNHGTPYGGITFTNGIIGQAASFDGVDDYMHVPTGLNLNIEGPLTIETWVYPRESGIEMPIVNGKGQYLLQIESDNRVRFSDSSGHGIGTNTDVLTLNAWNYVVGVFEGSSGDGVTLDNCMIYINGVSMGVQVIGSPWNPSSLTDLTIGRSQTTGAEVEIFDSTNIWGVQNGATRSGDWTISESTMITYMYTYHWNGGQGADAANIYIKQSSDDSIVWQGMSDSGLNHHVYPNAVLPAGTYYCTDNAEAWSYNDQSGGIESGFLAVFGRPILVSHYFNGIIDEIAIFARALTEDEILLRYQNAPVEGPRISVEPNGIYFGTVQTRNTTTEILTITNAGNEDLEIYSYSLRVGKNFSYEPELKGRQTVVLEPEKSYEIEITFAPTVEGIIADILEIHSNDPVYNMIEVELSGEGKLHLIDEIIKFFDESRDVAMIFGVGKNPEKELNDIRRNLNNAAGCIEAGENSYKVAINWLHDVFDVIDGKDYVKDTVIGIGEPNPKSKLASMVLELLILLGDKTDNDRDGLTYIEEAQEGTHPRHKDTDDDRIVDGEEVKGYLGYITDPLDADTDDDDVKDGDEVFDYKTDPTDKDSDDDYLPDGWEIKYGMDPKDEDEDNDLLMDWYDDFDGDELENRYEYIQDSSPQDADTDGDGMWDKYEFDCGIFHGGWQNATTYNTRYALLIAGGFNSTNNHVRYWNDLVDFYDLLVDHYNYDPRNIFVLYADGKVISTRNCRSNQPGGKDENNDGIPDGAIKVATHRFMVDGPATLNFLQWIFRNLDGRMSSNDFLVIMTTDHGDYQDNNHNGICDLGEESTLCLWNKVQIAANVFAGNNYLGRIQKYNRMAIFLEQCYSGGFLDDLSDNKRVIYSAVPCVESHGMGDLDGATRCPFIYYLGKAFIPTGGNIQIGTATYHTGSDDNGNHYISLEEAFDYSWDNDPYCPTYDQHKRDDPQNLDGKTYL